MIALSACSGEGDHPPPIGQGGGTYVPPVIVEVGGRSPGGSGGASAGTNGFSGSVGASGDTSFGGTAGDTSFGGTAGDTAFGGSDSVGGVSSFGGSDFGTGATFSSGGG